MKTIISTEIFQISFFFLLFTGFIFFFFFFFHQLHSDVDKGDGKVKYVLSGEGATSIFTIDENTGDIHATKRLDREAQAYYTLQAQAVDRLTNLPVEPKSEFVVKVQDINDNEPKFPDGPYLAGVPEMSPLGRNSFSIHTLCLSFAHTLAPTSALNNFPPHWIRLHLSVFRSWGESGCVQY